MKGKYRISYTVGACKYEFETVIERGDRVSNPELIAVVMLKVKEHYNSLYGDDSFGTRGRFSELLPPEFLGPAD